MKLEDFVAETLVGIQLGVSKAIQEVLKMECGGVINPQWTEHGGTGPHQVKDVSFDVAVIVNLGGGAEGQGEISVLGVDASGKAHVDYERSKESRIQFSIPVVPPTTRVDE